MAKIPKLIRFPENIVHRVEEYQKQKGIPSFTAALLELVRKGLGKSEDRP